MQRLFPRTRRSALRIAATTLAIALGGCSGGTEEPAAEALAPTVRTQPADLTVADGASASFSIEVDGSTPLTYQWERDGSPIDGATSSRYELATSVHARDHGSRYRVQVRNAHGSASSRIVQLTVTPLPAVIQTAPADTAVQAGSTARFTVGIASGTQPMTYQWRRDDSPIAGATQADYETPATSSADDGARYSVAVNNAAGTIVSAAATLTVTPAGSLPAIGAQPQDVTTLAGRSASFAVSASSSSALSYQWLKNGVPIEGANTADYRTAVLANTDSGALYSVVVTNATGSRTSRAATLTVNPRVVQVGAGGYLGSARKEDGSAWSWGTPAYLGGGGTGSIGSTQRVTNPDGSAFAGVADVSSGYVHSLAVRSDGSVWAWGDNSEGEIGDGSTTRRLHPVPVTDASGNPLVGAAAVSGGWRYSLALKADGTVRAWGYALMGRLGNNNTGSAVRSWRNPVTVLQVGGTPLAGVTQIDAGEDHAIALKSDGTTWIWGSGQAGRLGDGQRNSMAYVAQRLNDSSGAAIGNGVQVSAGSDHSLLVRADGTVYAWGLNTYGQLGDGSTTERDWATLVKDASGSTLTGVTRALAGEHFTVFLRSDGTVWSVGRNQYGQLGNGSSAALSLVPVQVRKDDGTPLTGVTRIALFDATVVVLRDDDTVWAWGDNRNGELAFSGALLSRTAIKLVVSGD